MNVWTVPFFFRGKDYDQIDLSTPPPPAKITLNDFMRNCELLQSLNLDDEQSESEEENDFPFDLPSDEDSEPEMVSCKNSETKIAKTKIA